MVYAHRPSTRCNSTCRSKYSSNVAFRNSTRVEKFLGGGGGTNEITKGGKKFAFKGVQMPPPPTANETLLVKQASCEPLIIGLGWVMS